MSDHIDLPWSISAKRRNRICGKDGRIVAEAWYPPARENRDAKLEARTIGNATAGFIVNAVNSYEDNQILITKLADALDHLNGLYQCNFGSNPHMPDWLEEALSLAKEKTSDA